MPPWSNDQSLTVARLIELAAGLDTAIRCLPAFPENVVPRSNMQHRYADTRGMPVYVGAIPVLAVIGVCDVIGEVGCGLLQEPYPILDRQMAVPLVGKWSEGIQPEASLPQYWKLTTFDIFLHFLEQIVALRSLQGVESLENCVRDDPSP